MDINQSQKILDLRRKILDNERAGLPSHSGISEEELHEGLAILRSNRVVAAQRGGATTAAKRSKATKAVDSAKLKDLLAGLDD